MNYFIQYLKPSFSPQSSTDINIPRTFEICNQKMPNSINFMPVEMEIAGSFILDVDINALIEMYIKI